MDDQSENNPALDLIHGSSSPTTSDERINDPLHHVDQSHTHHTKSVSEFVESAGKVCEAIDAARNDPESLRRVLGRLFELKMISRAESAETEIAKMSTISKYRKIGEHKKILLHRRVADKLCNGPTVLYELSLLIDKLPKDDDIAEQLGKFLEQLDGPLTRKWTQDLRETIAPKKRRTKNSHAATVENQNLAKNAHPIDKDRGKHAADEVAGATDEREVEPTPAVSSEAPDDDVTEDLVKEAVKTALLVPITEENSQEAVPPVKEPEDRISVLLATPDKIDAMAILSDEGYGNRRITVGGEIARDAVLLVQGKASDVLSIGRAICAWGFHRCAGVYALESRVAPDMTDSEVLVIYQGGASKLKVDIGEWPIDTGAGNLANRVVQGVGGRRVHLFAKSALDGWEPIVQNGNSNIEARSE